MGWLAAVAGIALAVGVLRTIENRLIYFPPRYPHGFPSHPDEEFAVADVWLLTADGVRINAFYRSNPTSKQALLWFHGNAENIGYGLPHLRALANLGSTSWPSIIEGTGKARASRMKRAFIRMPTRPTTT